MALHFCTKICIVGCRVHSFKPQGVAAPSTHTLLALLSVPADKSNKKTLYISSHFLRSNSTVSSRFRRGISIRDSFDSTKQQPMCETPQWCPETRLNAVAWRCAAPHPLARAWPGVILHVISPTNRRWLRMTPLLTAGRIGTHGLAWRGPAADCYSSTHGFLCLLLFCSE